MAKITIQEAYRHPQTDALVIHFRFDTGYESNVNIPPQQLRGLTEAEQIELVKKTLESIYKQRLASKEKEKLDQAARALEGLHIE